MPAPKPLWVPIPIASTPIASTAPSTANFAPLLALARTSPAPIIAHCSPPTPLNYPSLATAAYNALAESALATADVVIAHGAALPALCRQLGHTSPLPPPTVSTRPTAADDCFAAVPISLCDAPFARHAVVVVGGTFDRLHAGHRLLLTVASWSASERLWIGVASPALLSRKAHRALIAPIDTRSAAAADFARRVRPDIEVVVVELEDAAGPAGREDGIDAMVVSEETRGSAERINIGRRNRGLGLMEVIVVDLLGGSGRKLSSTKLREEEVERDVKR